MVRFPVDGSIMASLVDKNRIPIALGNDEATLGLGEFAVGNIAKIEFSLSPFQLLIIPK